MLEEHERVIMPFALSSTNKGQLDSASRLLTQKVLELAHAGRNASPALMLPLAQPNACCRATCMALHDALVTNALEPGKSGAPTVRRHTIHASGTARQVLNTILRGSEGI